MDLIDFQLIRKPRSNGIDSERHAQLSGDLAAGWQKLAADPKTGPQLPGRLREWMDEAPQVLHWAESDAVPDTPQQHALKAIAATDVWLTAMGDAPAGKAFAEFRKAQLAAQPSITEKSGLGSARDLICAWIIAALVLKGPKNTLAQLCRWLLIADLLDVAALADATLAADKRNRVVWDRLHRRDVVAHPQLLSGQGGPCVKLVREATVADLFVVRSEWSCYHAAEIASITNTLANSRFEIENKVTREEETVTTTDEERLEVTEQVEEDRTQTEMSKEIDRSASVQANLSGSVNVSGQYGFTKFGATASASVSASVQENVRQAAKISRDMVSKASAKVESRVRETRVRRTATKTEDRTLHAINNEGSPHSNGVYRWVDRVDRYQVFRFPNRFQLEFQLPEPAEYLRWRLTEGKAADAMDVPPPPAFDVVPTAITRNTYGALALKYRAANVAAPPDERVSVTEIVKGAYTGDPIKNRDVQWTYPRIEANATVTLPAGYLATAVTFDGVALPLRANWRVEASSLDPIDNKNDIEGFHQISLSVLAGSAAQTFDKNGSLAGSAGFTVQMSNSLNGDRSSMRFANTSLKLPQTSFAIAPAARDKVALGFIAGGASSAEVSFLISCQLSEQAFSEWRNSVYDALLDAWQGWDQAYRTAQLQKRAQGGPQGWDVTSPARNLELIRDELKRQVISWLLNDQAFAGRDAMVNRNNIWDLMDLDLAKQYAPQIQFFEQAFEWANMTYVCYPYYWARGARWPDLTAIEAADPTFAQFLRAGSARVVVPARPGMEQAVKYWLAYCEPDLGGPLPVPGDDDFLSIAQEIRDLIAPMAGGEPGPSWEARMSTPLLWLDPNNALPDNDDRQLGQAPHAPDPLLC